jgi:hypothetical protein
MNRIQIQRAVERYIKEAKRRDKRHRRSFTFGATLAGLLVPTVVVAGGGVPGFGTFVAWGLTAWGAYFLFRRLGRGGSERLLDELAERFTTLVPQDGEGYQVALTHLVKAKPRGDLLEALIQRIPGALDVDVETGGGTVTFGSVEGSAAKAKPKAAAKSGPAAKTSPWPGPFPGMPKGGPSEQLMALMKNSPFEPGDMLEQFLKANPEAQTIVSEQSDGKGGTVKTVKIFSSTTTTSTSGPASAQKPKPAKAKPPKPKPWKPAGALKPQREPGPEPAQDGPAFIPLDPYEADER